MNNHRYQQISATGDEIEGHRQQQTTTTPEAQQRSNLEEAFDIEDEDDDNYESHQLLPPDSHVLNPSSSSTSLQQYQGYSTATNDGVFSNMSAKPDSESNKTDEVPPAYEEAAADATPPYWQTTIIAPAGLGDMVLVEGLPVGSIFSFLWNLLVSSSFQLVGFMLTYLLHTSHAAKDGAKAGLGVTLIQYGFYIRSRK
ncbi:hypothetical protein K501DRAFT_40901 [Backusella circina FSU 941]|nr:hypothetical protein K501DRAFT_40901 [Backusella circina FSU 941]